MKLRFNKYLIISVFFAVVFFVGCATSPVEFSFLLDGQGASSVGFLTTNRDNQPSVALVSFEGRRLPRSESRTHWDPIIFPSDRELRMIVRVIYRETTPRVEGFGLIGEIAGIVSDVSALTRNVDTSVEFVSPPLEAGGKYQLSFVKGPGMPGRNILRLTNIVTGRIVHEDEFEVFLGGHTVR
ncbi:MAG: hypothetical protein FWC97_01200 [Treponema sp.]|nr:hypothetical protein [Treponema sp.]